MHVASMIQIMVTTLVVMACALYWLGRLFPAFGHRCWLGAGTVLRRLHAPARLVAYTTRRAGPRARRGCGGCSGCGGPDARQRRPHD